MIAIVFCEESLVARLRLLSPTGRAVFATIAAERAFNAYYERWKGAVPTINALRGALDALWLDLAGPAQVDTLESHLAHCYALVKPEDEQPTQAQQHEDDVVAAICYALRARLTGEPQEVVWAARRVYETLDTFVLQTNKDIEIGTPDGEERVVSHPVIAAEIRRQLRDLETLEAQESSGAALNFRELRARAALEGGTFWGTVKSQRDPGGAR